MAIFYSLSSTSYRIATRTPLRLRPTHLQWLARSVASDTQAGPSRSPSDPQKLENSTTARNTSPPNQAQPADPSPSASSSASSPFEQASSLSQWRKQLCPTNLNDFASQFRERMSLFGQTTRVMLSQLGGKINHVTGYEEIDALKRQVTQNDESLREARATARNAKQAADDATLARSQSQRELNDLLQRKHNWTDGDVARFTHLIKDDHRSQQTETQAKAAATAAEDAVEREFDALMRSILARYHEEQVWSDKIRSISTYGQMTIMGLNVLVFVLAVILVEPYKRRKIVEGVEGRIVEANERNKQELEKAIQEVQERLGVFEGVVLHQIGSQNTQGIPTEIPPAMSTSSSQDDSGESQPPPRSSWTLELQNPSDYTLVLAGAFGAGAIGWLLRSLYP